MDQIIPNDTLILYKDLNYPYLRYDEIKKDEEFIIYVQDMAVLREECPRFDFWSIWGNTDKIEIFEDKTKDELKVSVNDTMIDLVTKIKNEIWTLRPEIRRDGTDMDIILNGMKIGGMKSRDFHLKIIEWGIKYGSVICEV